MRRLVARAATSASTATTAGIVVDVADAAVTVAVADATAGMIVEIGTTVVAAADAVSSQTAGTVEVAASGHAYARPRRVLRRRT